MLRSSTARSGVGGVGSQHARASGLAQCRTRDMAFPSVFKLCAVAVLCFFLAFPHLKGSWPDVSVHTDEPWLRGQLSGSMITLLFLYIFVFAEKSIEPTEAPAVRTLFSIFLSSNGTLILLVHFLALNQESQHSPSTCNKSATLRNEITVWNSSKDADTDGARKFSSGEKRVAKCLPRSFAALFSIEIHCYHVQTRRSARKRTPKVVHDA